MGLFCWVFVVVALFCFNINSGMTLRSVIMNLTVKVRVYSLNEELQPARRETVLTVVVCCNCI